MKRNFTKLMAAFALLVGLTIPMGMWGQTRAEGDTHEFEQSLEQLLNNNALISSITPCDRGQHQALEPSQARFYPSGSASDHLPLRRSHGTGEQALEEQQGQRYGPDREGAHRETR